MVSQLSNSDRLTMFLMEQWLRFLRCILGWILKSFKSCKTAFLCKKCRSRSWFCTQVLPLLVFIIIWSYLDGWMEMAFERSYHRSFEWPCFRGDLRQSVEQFLDGKGHFANMSRQVNFRSNHSFMISNSRLCQQIHSYNGKFLPLKLTVLVKSKLTQGENRDAIRKTWLNLTRYPEENVKKLFVVGSCESLLVKESHRINWPSFLEMKEGDHGKVIKRKQRESSHRTANMTVEECKKYIEEENRLHGDILQIDYIETYYNNTYKTLSSLRWAFENCKDTEYLVLIDDDYYLSMKNLLLFLKNPLDHNASRFSKEFIPYDGRLYAGWVISGWKPPRHFSKWYTSLYEYPFNIFPDYVTGGITVFSNRAFKELYAASLFVNVFKLDDINLGIVAKKIGLLPLQNLEMSALQPKYSPDVFSSVIARHFSQGFPNSMLHAWFDQQRANNV